MSENFSCQIKGAGLRISNRVLTILFEILLLLVFQTPDVWALDKHHDRNDCSKNWWQFENRGWFLPLVSGLRAAEVKVNLGGISRYNFADRAEWLGQDPRIGIDMSVGKEIPVFGYEDRASCESSIVDADYGFGIWVPISFHMLWDLGASSFPIINTDYRFGVMLKVVKGLPRNQRMGLRLTLGHESSHLGDELSLFANGKFPVGGPEPPFERINVSYEFWELVLSWEAEGFLGGEVSKVRLGLSGLFHPNEKGFYSFDLSETNGREVVGSKRHFEPHIGMEWREDDPLFGWPVFPFISFHYGPRIVYNYQKSDRSAREKMDWKTFNLIIGITDKIYEPANIFGRTDFHLRLYHGVNPHGQFRNERNFLIYGIGFTVHV